MMTADESLPEWTGKMIDDTDGNCQDADEYPSKRHSFCRLSSSSTVAPDDEGFLSRTVSESSTALSTPSKEDAIGRLMGFVSGSPVKQEDNHVVTEEEYVVDNSFLRAHTLGLAYRLSERESHRDHSRPGPFWGTSVQGVRSGDGWLRVGDHFLPMQVAGVPVLKLKADSALDDSCKEGPALTSDGCVLDLDSGAAIYFSSSKELAQGHDMALLAKESARMARAASIAHAACDGEERICRGEGACSIDDSGVLMSGSLTLTTSCAATERLKRFHSRRRSRHLQSSGGCLEDCVVCIDPNGRALLQLYLAE
eukprot:gb/GFBE01045849.1/.p1 GENE.gb/GFBE01045849.1/~~gb/GFBE01045849.1/.p1  ORF type:complete len:310 (+),score=54.41 gb/GFBE01045849.1/:1-930(+)